MFHDFSNEFLSYLLLLSEAKVDEGPRLEGKRRGVTAVLLSPPSDYSSGNGNHNY